jgi:hypothetical protein
MAKFKYYEEVIIKSERKELKEINGKAGVIFSDPTKDYIVVYITDLGEAWDVKSNELNSTGKFFKYEDFYDGSSISVKVDSKGRGKII